MQQCENNWQGCWCLLKSPGPLKITLIILGETRTNKYRNTPSEKRGNTSLVRSNRNRGAAQDTFSLAIVNDSSDDRLAGHSLLNYSQKGWTELTEGFL